jgi:uncharacterized protein
VKITRLNVHPIKGCRAIPVERATVNEYGLAGDREWQVVDADGAFMTQRKHPALARVQPALTAGGIVLRAEGMDDLEVRHPAKADTTTTTYTGDVPVGDAGAAAAEWFSAYLGEPVRLVGIAPGYDRRFGDVFATALNLGDACPVLVVNEASHRFLADRAEELFGLDRWRTNLVVDGAEPWAEDTWRTLRVGAATVQCVMPWPRCAVPQVDQETGERHREPAIVLKAHRWCPELPDATPLEKMMLPGNALFGMASSIEPVGAEIAVGDEVEVLATGEPLLRI